jgi:hypothetical protein
MLGNLSAAGLVLLLVVCGPLALRAQQPPAASEGVLVLRNGSVLIGQVVRAGDTYLISSPGMETRLRAGDVDFFCRDLAEAYGRKRLALSADDLQGRLELAAWCLRHDLLDQAEEQAAAVLQAAPQSRRAQALRQQIADRRRDLAAPRPKAEAAASGPRTADLELLVRGLPASTVTDFTDVIQPLLLNHCAAAGCHGPRSTSAFRLLKPSRGPSKRLTHRNLHAAVTWIDRADPARSRLLTAAGEPHGGLSLPVFSRTKATHYRQLSAWVAAFGSAAAPEEHAPGALAQPVPLAMSPLSDSAALVPVPSRASRLRPTRGRTPAVDQPAEDASQTGVAQAAWFAEPPPPTPRGRRPMLRAAAPRPASGDPFDPEAFNRRFAPREPDAAEPRDESIVPRATGFLDSPDAEQAVIDAVEAELRSLGAADLAE